jgi:hypothetical protein
MKIHTNMKAVMSNFYIFSRFDLAYMLFIHHETFTMILSSTALTYFLL